MDFWWGAGAKKRELRDGVVGGGGAGVMAVYLVVCGDVLPVRRFGGGGVKDLGSRVCVGGGGGGGDAVGSGCDGGVPGGVQGCPSR